MAGIIGGGSRHYRGRGMGVHAGQGHIDPEQGFIPSAVVGETQVGGATQWKCPTCRTENISNPVDGCPSCGAGTQVEVERAMAERDAAVITPDEIARTLFGAGEVTGEDLVNWAKCLRGPAQLTLCRALAHYAETGDPSLGEVKKDEIVAWARAVMPGEDQ